MLLCNIISYFSEKYLNFFVIFSDFAKKIFTKTTHWHNYEKNSHTAIANGDEIRYNNI